MAFLFIGPAFICPPVAAQTSFGSVAIGASITSTVTLTIPAATLGSISVASQGATGLDFANGGAGTCAAGSSDQAGQTCTIEVIFKTHKTRR
jgi:hypothetical protein